MMAGPASWIITSAHSVAQAAPFPVRAAERNEVAHVDVQRGRVVRQLDELERARERRRVVEQIAQRDHRQDPAAAARARRHGGVLEPTGEREQVTRLGRVEADLAAVGVEHDELGDWAIGDVGHGRTVAPVPVSWNYGRRHARARYRRPAGASRVTTRSPTGSR